MLDIKIILEKSKVLDETLWRRHPDSPMLAKKITALYKNFCQQEAALQQLRQEKNALSQWNASDSDQDRHARIAQSSALKIQEENLVATSKMAKESFESMMMALPNWIADDVPDGRNEEANQEIKRWGTPGPVCVGFMDHGTWGRHHGLLDTDQASKISGARFTYLMGDLARLERALGQWMLDVQSQKFGFTEMTVPYLVRQNAVYGSGQWPKFKDDLFVISDERDRFLIPTAEVPLVNWAADRIWNESDLPLCLTALTPCFRSEVGSAGKDTTGMLRQHQFNKVELVAVCTPETADQWHKQMLKQAEYILEALELPYRTVVLCAGDMGASAEKTYDIEVWVPSQNRYREIASCSKCGDYQARRMQARYRRHSDGKIGFLHTLNGSGLAVGRTLLALIENFQCADGTVKIPGVLQPYMGGKTSIGGQSGQKTTNLAWIEPRESGSVGLASAGESTP
ncbi:MAG: serine--tRNA ligase [Alphaproteobacteria bacterium]|nr:serine--tRNA ligase [Alphaproteobacteria bacterium]